MMVTTYPVGLGRDDWRTPEGNFKIRGRTKDPTWVIPESIRAEHIADRGDARRSIPGGAADNPLGKYRLELTLPSYALHGSNVPWGVGMQVSHGCIRLYNEDIAELYREVEVGVPGRFLYQPVKVGARDGVVYIEVHRDLYRLRGDPAAQADEELRRRGWLDRVDPNLLRQALLEQTGMPVAISTRER
jgi:L,D-transpeptidase ErfK/SrfK